MARPEKITAHDLTVLLTSGGALQASDMAARLGVDRSTVTRTLSRLGSQIAAVGATRRTRYVLRRKVRDMDTAFPLYRIDPDGRAHPLGLLEAFHGAWRIEWAGAPPAWARHFTDADGLWPELPFFLKDLRPLGYLGQGPAGRTARSYRIAEDAARWSDDDLLCHLAVSSEDLTGDLVVGDDCLRRALARVLAPEAALAPHQALTRYPEWVARGVAAESAGGWVGGDTPRFLASLDDSGGERRAVAVKFSPPTAQPQGRRWADLLAMEYHALEILAELGLAERGHRLIDAGGRRFLELARHDRTPSGGRRGVVSLGALHAAAVGGAIGEGSAAVTDLWRAGLVAEDTVVAARRLQAFSELIGAGMLGCGGLVFRVTDELPFHLAPVGEMPPIQWAPGPQGEISERVFSPQPPLPAAESEWREMLGRAREFWTRVIADPRVSREFAASARAAGETLARLGGRFGE